jgi:hypothetical protein
MCNARKKIEKQHFVTQETSENLTQEKKRKRIQYHFHVSQFQVTKVKYTLKASTTDV